MNATLQQYLQAYRKAKEDLDEYRRNTFKPGDLVKITGCTAIGTIAEENYTHEVEFVNLRVSVGGMLFGTRLEDLEKI